MFLCACVCVCDGWACPLTDGHVDPVAALILTERCNSEKGYGPAPPLRVYTDMSSCLLQILDMQILHSLLLSHHFCVSIHLSQLRNHHAIFLFC